MPGMVQAYFIASTARKKLNTEAAQPDLHLRILVGHANMLDTIMKYTIDNENHLYKSATSKSSKRAVRRPWPIAQPTEPKDH